MSRIIIKENFADQLNLQLKPPTGAVWQVLDSADKLVETKHLFDAKVNIFAALAGVDEAQEKATLDLKGGSPAAEIV
ncbi:MAG TPA: hypothetical protein EYO33_01050, partial [Phycisphaerales bacterium]|nr:hypothetical protein [Phycisphaerales bacterium]